jgi:hypothetical protein
MIEYLVDNWLWVFSGLLFGLVTHPTAVRNGLCDYVVDQLDISTPPGKLKFKTAADAIVATLTFSNPAFGAASSGTATVIGITPDTNAVGGVITKATLDQGGGTTIVNCSVTATGGGGDITLNSTTVSAGQTVSMTTLTYSAPA